MTINDIFFDLDNTLWDFEKNSQIALKEIYHDFSIAKYFSQFTDFHLCYRHANEKLWQAYEHGEIPKTIIHTQRFADAFKACKTQPDSDTITRIADQYRATAPRNTHLYPHTLEMLDTLKANHYRLHIITNGIESIQSTKLDHADLRKYFEVIVCSETLGKTKPNPDIFAHAISQAGTNSSTAIMIGDDLENDVMGAESFGIKAILFDPDYRYPDNTHEYVIRDWQRLPQMLAEIATPCDAAKI